MERGGKKRDSPSTTKGTESSAWEGRCRHPDEARWCSQDPQLCPLLSHQPQVTSLPYSAQHTPDLILQKIPVVQKYKRTKIFLSPSPTLQDPSQSQLHAVTSANRLVFSMLTHMDVFSVQYLLKSITGILMYIFLCFASSSRPQIYLRMFPRDSTSEGILFVSFVGWSQAHSTTYCPCFLPLPFFLKENVG